MTAGGTFSAEPSLGCQIPFPGNGEGPGLDRFESGRPSVTSAGSNRVAGVILSWAHYIEGMQEFQQKTYPLVVQVGL